MPLEYHLHPPFLHIPEETSFSGAWEAFCRRMLTLQLGTENILRRRAPDEGVDLFDLDHSIAFQCKAVESLAGRLRVAGVVTSLRRALAAREQIGWRRFDLCTNVDVTAAQEVALRRLLPEIGIRGRSFWQDLCRRHPDVARRYFRPIAPVPNGIVDSALTAPAAIHFTQDLREQLARDRRRVLLYSHRADRIYDLAISGESTVSDVCQMLQALLLLPFSYADDSEGAFVAINYSLVHEGRRFGGFEQQTIAELGIVNGSVIGLEIAIHVRNRSGVAESRSMAAFEGTHTDELDPLHFRAERLTGATESAITLRFTLLNRAIDAILEVGETH